MHSSRELLLLLRMYELFVKMNLSVNTKTTPHVLINNQNKFAVKLASISTGKSQNLVRLKHVISKVISMLLR